MSFNALTVQNITSAHRMMGGTAVGRAKRTRIVPMPTASATTAQPGWTARTIRAIAAMLRAAIRMANNTPSPAPAAMVTPAAAMATATKGATPTHNRALSLLAPRILTDIANGYNQTHPAIVGLRKRAKTIKNVPDAQTADAALAVLDTLVTLVDAFIPLWETAGNGALTAGQIGTGDRARLHAEMLETVARLDDELERILTPGDLARNQLDTVKRYVETRYAPTGDYGLDMVE